MTSGDKTLAVGVRSITNTGSRKVIGKFPSRKMNTTIWWESQIERDYIYLLEIDPNVVSYKGQPFKLTYISSGVTRSYTPDFWVQRPDRQQVVEVKPTSKVNQQKNFDLFRHITPICQAQGMEFVVVTDTMIRMQPQLDNIKLLTKYARSPLTLQNYLDLKRYFAEREPTSLKEACLDLKSIGIEKNSLLKLLYFGFLETDLRQHIGEQSLIQTSQFPGDIKALLRS